MSEDDGQEIGEGFELLSNETRIGILRALSERLKEDPDDPTIGFSDLRRKVGLRDSGNFNYHLSQLEGHFVEKTETGYRIAPAGLQVLAAIIAGTYSEGDDLGPVEITDDCPACGERLSARYRDNLLEVSCPNEHRFVNAIPPGAIDGRDLPEILRLMTLETQQQMELAVHGICPYCMGRLEWSIDPEPEGPFPEFGNQCGRCGVKVNIPVVACLLAHPKVISFYANHDINVRERPLWAKEFFQTMEVEIESDPVTVTVEIQIDGDELSATIAQDLSILDISV